MNKVEQKTCVLHLFVASLLIVSPVYPQSDPLEGLDAYILKSMAEWQVPGVAIAIVKDDSVVLLKGYGAREVGKDMAVDPRTVFAIGSNTKAFTAAAVAMLVDEGKVSWDDPVIEHLPWFQLPDPWVTQQVTIRDLLAHRVAGDIGHPTGRLSGWPSPDFLTREEVLRRLRFLELGSRRFRSAFVYCNECYMAAAEIVAKLGAKAEIARELCYRLYTLCERKKRATEALAYNGLVQSWPEITRLARETPRAMPTGTDDMFNQE